MVFMFQKIFMIDVDVANAKFIDIDVYNKKTCLKSVFHNGFSLTFLLSLTKSVYPHDILPIIKQMSQTALG